MKIETDVVIVGNGTAALATASEVKQYTENFVMVSNGVYGTTCVRAGCMPATALIHAANLYHQRKQMGGWGIENSSALTLDSIQVLAKVRELRKHFLSYSLESIERYRPHIAEGKAYFQEPTYIQINDDSYSARSVIIATGSTPIVPPALQDAPHVITSDNLFDLNALPDAIAVVGLSILGTEMAQAFARLGINVTAYHDEKLIAGLTDPEVNKVATDIMKKEIRLETALQFDDTFYSQLKGTAIFIALSREANLNGMGLEAVGICPADKPVVDFNPLTMQVKNLPVFVAGDVKLGRSILHEACDEGHIAGYNAVQDSPASFKRRVPLQVCHTNPAIAVVGTSWSELPQGQFFTGKASYENQGRATIEGRNQGLIHIYADRNDGALLGAELVAPDGEHIAHMLAWLIDRGCTVEEALHLPFYHPTVAEGVRTALEDIAKQLALPKLATHGLSC